MSFSKKSMQVKTQSGETATATVRRGLLEKEVIVPQPRCRHCNHMAGSQGAQKKHQAQCIYAPVQRSKNSPTRRLAMRKRMDNDANKFPTIRVHAPTHHTVVHEYVELQTMCSMVSLGHLTTSDASTAADMDARILVANGLSEDVHGCPGLPRWRHNSVRCPQY